MEPGHKSITPPLTSNRAERPASTQHSSHPSNTQADAQLPHTTTPRALAHRRRHDRAHAATPLRFGFLVCRIWPGQAQEEYQRTRIVAAVIRLWEGGVQKSSPPSDLDTSAMYKLMMKDLWS